MLTQRSRYALRAMLLIAHTPPDGPPTPMSRIADEAQVPRKFLEIILAELRTAGLLVSTRGKYGGFHLAHDAADISFGDIIRVIEGPLALVPCVSRTAYRRCKDCKDESTCEIRRAMMDVRDDTARILEGRSLADAIAHQPPAQRITPTARAA
ncbi:MAG: Rrf2 family transcriptional regulator [Alphaproteobacteria bacterium]|nr:Rrf2 family transcriptional regulator [Alphaproteobacteria bacterium]